MHRWRRHQPLVALEGKKPSALSRRSRLGPAAGCGKCAAERWRHPLPAKRPHKNYSASMRSELHSPPAMRSYGELVAVRVQQPAGRGKERRVRRHILPRLDERVGAVYVSVQRRNQRRPHIFQALRLAGGGGLHLLLVVAACARAAARRLFFFFIFLFFFIFFLFFFYYFFFGALSAHAQHSWTAAGGRRRK